MRVRNGYVTSKKGGKEYWRKLPRRVWQRIQWQHQLRLQDKKNKH